MTLVILYTVHIKVYVFIQNYHHIVRRMFPYHLTINIAYGSKQYGLYHSLRVKVTVTKTSISKIILLL